MRPFRQFPWEVKVICPHCEREVTLALIEDMQLEPFGEDGDAYCPWIACQKVIRFRVTFQDTTGEKG